MKPNFLSYFIHYCTSLEEYFKVKTGRGQHVVSACLFFVIFHMEN